MTPRRPASPARRRALLLLALLSATAGCWLAVPLTMLLWWGALPVTALLVLDVVAGIVAARHRGRRRAVLARVRAQEQRRQVREAAAADEVARLARAAVAARQEKQAAADGTWVPVPVPPPTYTLKQSVRRSEPAPLAMPLAGARAASDGAPAQWDELIQRKVVNG